MTARASPRRELIGRRNASEVDGVNLRSTVRAMNAVIARVTATSAVEVAMPRRVDW